MMSLLNRWKSKDKNVDPSNTIKKAPLDANIPLSYGQKRLWFLQQMYPNNAFYNISESFTFEGFLNINVLKQSFNAFFKKHHILKSYYDVEDDKPILKIDDSISPNFIEEDFTSYDKSGKDVKLKSYMDKQAHFGFNLSSAPLFKGSILKIEENKYILLLTFHHIIADQWSMGLLKEEIASYYKQLSQGLNLNTEDNSIGFKDYAYWQNKHQTFDNQKAYWKKKLSGEIPILDLPIDNKRPLTPSFQGNDLTLKFSKKTSTQILEVAKRLEVTPFVLFLSAYYLLLNNFTKQEDILIGTPISNRNEKQLEKVFGLFIDTIVLRKTVNKSSTISEFINEVKAVFTDALSNKDIPFDVLVKELNVERSLAINPIFQAMFVYTSKPELPSFGKDLELLENSDYIAKVSKFDLTLFITDLNGEISSTFEYATDLFEEKTIERFQHYLKLVLKYFVKNTNENINSIPFLTKTDETFIIQNNKSNKNPFQGYNAIHNIIEDIAKKHPKNLALSFGKESINYKTLNEKANIVAQELQKNTSKKNTVVGLCTERSLDMIIGLLGILKAGFAYLPIDPDYPTKRIEFMLKDAKVDTVVTHTSILNLFENFEVKPVIIDDIDYSDNNNVFDLPKVKESDLAYVIYTSGSTGHPKGVPITHKNIINSTGGRLNFYDKNPSAFLLMSSISFDSSKAGIFWTLCTGGNLIITKKRIEQDIEEIANTIEAHNISHTLMLPSLYHVILENVETTKLKSLTTVMVAGEACSKPLCDTHFKTMPNVSLYNEYGPTEASVWCIANKIDRKDLKKENISIGKPVANAQIHILDNDRKQVPFGVTGEIYVGGIGLSNGYLDRPELTEKAFIKNPFRLDEKLYKTGDLGKYRNDGSIDFLGRADQQIKIRGYRIELDAIENTLNKDSSVKQAVVLVKQDESKPKRLIAYIKAEVLFNEHQLKRNLKEMLPDYMIPSSFVEIDKIPLLPNGKVDRTSLVNIEVISKPNETRTIVKPKNDMEQKLLDIWKDILNIKNLNTTDNFFEIGGDSILSIQIIAKARKAGISIAPNQLFEHQTISELAMFVSIKNKTNSENGTMVIGDIPLTPIQEWFFETHKLAPEYWNQGFKIKDLPKTFSKNALEEITKQTIKTHDALRLSFYLEHEKWIAKVLKPEIINAFEVINISNEIASNYDIKIEENLKHIQENSTLESGSLFKCIYFETGDISNNTIILLAHHLVIDFVSWQIILNSYTDAIQKVGFIKPDVKTTSIKTWGNHFLELAKSETILNELGFWEAQVPTETLFLQDYKNSLPILQKDVSVINHEIDAELTQNLVEHANNTYNTKTDELLLTALIDTIKHYTNSKNITFALERHGRETKNTNIDLSNTVGWFTSFFPKKFDFDATSNIASKIITIKEQMRSIPNGGIGYGVLRYLTSHLESSNYPEIVFNFLGKQNTGETSVEFVSKNTLHPLSERHYVIEINALIKNGVIEVTWFYGNNILKKDTVLSLIDNFNDALKNIVTHCLNSETKYTPSDFPEVDLKQEELDMLVNNEKTIQDIEGLFPLNIMQQGILFHSLTSKYDQGFLNIQCTIDGNLDTTIFGKAWDLVARRHSILRTSVHWKNLQTPIQLVKQKIALDLEVLDWSILSETQQQNELNNIKQINRDKGVDFEQNPISKVLLIKTRKDSHYLIWSCHHLLLDGWSSSIVLKDLFTLYDALLNHTEALLPTIPNQKSYLNWLNSIDVDSAKTFWKSTFKDFNTPFLFNEKQLNVETLNTYDLKLSKDTSSMANSLAKSYQVTLNTLFQGIWSLIISKYSGNSDITFGNTVSGRSGNFPNLNLIAGMFANVLPFRTIINNDYKIKNWLKDIQLSQLETRNYEHFSLTEINEWIDFNSTNLLDNLFIFENYPWDDFDIGDLKIHSSTGGITTTYPLTITIKSAQEIEIYLMSEEKLFSSKINYWILNRFEEIILLLNNNCDINLNTVLSKIIPAPKQIKTHTSSIVIETNSIVSPKNKTELELLTIWETLLGKNNISVEDNFFEIGGKSLLAIKMFSLIEEKLKIKIPPIKLLENPTIKLLSMYILKDKPKDTWKFVIPIKPTGSKTPLFSIHGGGGYVFFFNPIANGLDKERPMYAIQPAGINDNQKMHKSIEDMAKDYAKEIKDIQPNGPYNLLVYCFSSAVGIEIAEEFKKYGDKTNLIVIDSIIKQEDFADPERIKMRIYGFLNRLRNNPINALKLMIVNNYERFLEPTMINLFSSSNKKNLEKIKQNLLKIYVAYKWQKKHTGSTTIILTEKPDKNLNPTYIKAWEGITTNDVNVLYTDGIHHQLFNSPYAEMMSNQIEKAILEIE